MYVDEKLQNLTEEQTKKLEEMNVDEGVTYLKGLGIELTDDEILEIKSRIPDDALDEAAGGMVFTPMRTVETNCRKCGVKIIVNAAWGRVYCSKCLPLIEGV